MRNIKEFLDAWFAAKPTKEARNGIDEACRHIRNFVEHKELPDEELI